MLAAHRAGIKRVVLPQRNARDLDEVPKEAREAMEFIFANDMSEVIAAALEDLPAVSGKSGLGQSDAGARAAH